MTQAYSHSLFGDRGEENPAKRARLKREFQARRAVSAAGDGGWGMMSWL
jgi:hypothetical protein